ncbi:hypothetical protein [Beijerinckia indica]|uniref:Uncharacterized protein n=1 Tax=Beijerinckia indica subsp. indica (strain ATCC 9039 / DSM 1715 / NCIMB 8712) TaxID=395963 RepID=B2IDL1_BEII9|nr:hypothetical protein [Beijerinckia indica]ACB95447.1 conserved hypothetical protein [Beijerinckia indica subsp. indica ATCC 9039]
MKFKSLSKTVAVAGIVVGLALAGTAPSKAGDGGAIAAGVIGGLALGALAGSAAAGAYAPPPPPPYAAYAPPPPRVHCWREPREVWDPYIDDYVVRPVRVCD